MENKKERTQFDFSKEALERFDKTAESIGGANRIEAMRNALRLYGWIVNDVDPESTIKAVLRDGQEVNIPVKFFLGNR